jgi:thioredoxin-like negative regulator of GroEL
MRITDKPLVIAVWVMPGCGACEEYLPRFRQVAGRYSRCIPSVIIDATKNEEAANAFRVKATPTTMVVRNGRRGAFSIEGSADAERIEELYSYAFFGLDCKI